MNWLMECIGLYKSRFDSIESNQAKIEKSTNDRIDKLEASTNNRIEKLGNDIGSDISRLYNKIDDLTDKQSAILDKIDGLISDVNDKTTDNIISIAEIKTKLGYWGTIGGIISGAAISWAVAIVGDLFGNR